jgi:predicted CopG family antitoxin
VKTKPRSGQKVVKGGKLIRLQVEIYGRLVKKMKKGESFNDAVARLVTK